MVVFTTYVLPCIFFGLTIVAGISYFVLKSQLAKEQSQEQSQASVKNQQNTLQPEEQPEEQPQPEKLKPLRKKRKFFTKKHITNACFILCFLVFIPLTWLFGLNGIIVFIKANANGAVKFYSPIGYGEALLCLVSFGGSIWITFFQYRIQKVLQKKNDEEKARLEQVQKEETARQKQAHIDEIISERLRSLHLLTQATAINYNLPSARKPLSQEIPFHFIIGEESGQPCFYQTYFRSCNKELTVVQGEKNIKIAEPVFSPNTIEFDLDLHNEEFDDEIKKEIKRLFLYPAMPYDQKKAPPKLDFGVHIQAEDASFGQNTDCQINYWIFFSVIPDSAYGYSNRGCFSLKIKDIYIKSQ